MNPVERGAFLDMLPRLQAERNLHQYSVLYAVSPYADEKERQARQNIVNGWQREAAGPQAEAPKRATPEDIRTQLAMAGIMVKTDDDAR